MGFRTGWHAWAISGIVAVTCHAAACPPAAALPEAPQAAAGRSAAAAARIDVVDALRLMTARLRQEMRGTDPSRRAMAERRARSIIADGLQIAAIKSQILADFTFYSGLEGGSFNDDLAAVLEQHNQHLVELLHSLDFQLRSVQPAWLAGEVQTFGLVSAPSELGAGSAPGHRRYGQAVLVAAGRASDRLLAGASATSLEFEQLFRLQAAEAAALRKLAAQVTSIVARP